jgi:hypothetical protein
MRSHMMSLAGTVLSFSVEASIPLMKNIGSMEVILVCL